jgi:hypothetical protein
MRINISQRSSFEEVAWAAGQAYNPGNIYVSSYRNLILKLWGSMVGRKRALEDLHEFIKKHGTKKAAAAALHMSPKSLREIELHYQSILDDLDLIPEPLSSKMIRNEVLSIDEDRECEFKEVKGSNPVDSIKNTVDEYAISFLNSEGGRILWGITDAQKMILGIHLTASQRDQLRREIVNKLVAIQPSVDPTAFRITFHQVYEDDTLVKDVFIVEVTIPKANTPTLHFSGSGETWVRIDGVKQKLKGPAIQDWLMRRLVISSAQSGFQGAA